MSKKSQNFKYKVMDEIKKHRKNNPIKSRQLEAMFSLRGVNIREIVHWLRVGDHLPICSDSAGYFYARNKFEAEHTIRQLRSRIKHINEAVCGIEQADYPPETDKQQGFGFKIKSKFDGRYPD